MMRLLYRCVPAELLIQMDGLMGKKQKGSSGPAAAEEPQVFVLAATNMPWELDMVRNAWGVKLAVCLCSRRRIEK
jgi:SpoVK/Ycf46/Vps4 family AAA+-type ATPase